MTPTLADCRTWDAEDPLAFTRQRFRLPAGVIYLDGNSLGALPTATAARLADLVEREWGRGLIGSWNDAGWMALPARVGARIAGLIGAGDDEVVAADSTSVNLYKLAAAAVGLRPERRIVVSEPGNFPSDLYVLQGLCAALGLELRLAPPEAIAAALTDEVALLVLTHVHYRSGRVHDMAALTAAAQAKGALTLWDLSAAGGSERVQCRFRGGLRLQIPERRTRRARLYDGRPPTPCSHWPALDRLDRPCRAFRVRRRLRPCGWRHAPAHGHPVGDRPVGARGGPENL
jgi:kynureninase